MPLSVAQFVANLGQTGLMSAADVSTLCDRLPQADRPADGEALAKLLIRQGKLTKYQAQAIYSGKHQNLVFGEYVVLDKLGAGGMGVVLKAQHRRMKRTVAIKVLPAAAMKKQDAIDRFFREVEAAAKLMHPNIVAAHDAGEHGGMHFLVMEYVEGRDLAAVVAEIGPLPVEQAIDYMLQAARGLEFAHARGVVHRDIKPANLLLSSEGQVKILDMGLARLSESPGATEATAAAQLTQSGQVMGTVDYMSPEQAMDTRTADHRADIYALGCTLYKLLTGQAAYDGDTMMKKLMAHQQAPIPSLRTARPDCPEALDDIFQQMVAKRPEDRYQSMAEVIAALQQVGSAVRTNAAATSQVVRTADPTGGTSQSKDAMGVAGGSATVGGALPRPSHPAPGRATPGTGSLPKAGEAPTLALSDATVDTDPQTQTTMAAAIAQAAEAATASARRLNRRFGSKTLIAALGFLILVGAAAAYVIRVTTAAGEVVIHCEVPGIEVSIARDGSPVKGMTLEKAETTERIGVGDVKVTVKGSRANEFKVTQDSTTLLRNGKVVVRIEMIATAKAADGSPSKPLAAGTKQGEEWSGNGLAMKFCWCPPGDFKMGEGKDAVDVKLTSGFWLGKYEVTQAEYQRVMKGNPSHFSATGQGKSEVAGLNTDRFPVEAVSWNDAAEFCRVVTDSERREGRLPAGWEYRLPTEAQWEYACRAGTRTAYSFGDVESRLSDYGWCDANAKKRTHEVGQKPPNPWGLHDVHGNVWEWCRDWRQEEVLGGRDPEVVERATHRVYRGGSWRDSWRCGSAFRGRFPPDDRGSALGFRVALVQIAAHSAAPLLEIGAKPGDEWSGNGLAMKFCWCPPGEFKMGSPQEQASVPAGKPLDNEAQVQVKLTRGFWLGKFEVTQAEYRQVTKSTPSHFSATGQGKDLVNGVNTDKFPVEMVSWVEATEYCRAFTEQERQAGRLPAGWEYTLPTEAQWEYACRAGAQTRFSFGDQETAFSEHAWHLGNSDKRTHEVGQKRANLWGLNDMHGNVYEWCRDWYQEKLPGGSDPEVVDQASHHVTRGGSWDYSPWHARAAFRSRNTPDNRRNHLGFRVALVQTPPPAAVPLKVGEKAGQEWSGNGLSMKFCWCPGGEFKMGESPNQVDVQLTRGFWFGKHEVTQAEFQQVMKSNPSHFSATGKGKNQVAGLNTDKFPVEQVTWDEATQFCRTLTDQERSQGRLPADWVYTLPTEAQWESACRAGTPTVYSFGDQETDLSEYAWYFSNSDKRSHEVGQKRPNGWGLYDMHGNVWEWCRDWHQAKPKGGRDPEVVDGASVRVHRGGGWDNLGRYCWSSQRHGDVPEFRYQLLGFRVALVQQAESGKQAVPSGTKPVAK